MTLNNASEISASGNAKVQIGNNTRLTFQILDSPILREQITRAMEQPGMQFILVTILV
ncbi:hypothetical protein JDV02_003534 [Purpureocillium takamizusanense]|uniref:Uncharacterized protein n=1 Tax=Purpureocillium takamizusanense TaxID=2060973 RepID=A0A9Q8QD20_9HYPO|nr:uncharacterized protein JDV02_003534 [Purpureocillium takamizusanense]UNI17158.1 hypothetical protein JDV02_003534 [Purpureocillium takamizusanense]